MVDFRAALPEYLKGYVRFLDSIAQFFTGRKDARVKVSYQVPTDTEAKGDAAILSPIVEHHFAVLINRYPLFVGLFMWVKYTFFKIRVKIVDPAELKSANPPKTEEAKHGSGKPGGESGT